MQNATRPISPNLSEGCFNCGNGKDQVLASRTVNGASLGLCKTCHPLPAKEISVQPYCVRAK